MENQKLISKNNSGKTVGWWETYFSKDETVDVSVHRNVSTVTTRDRTTSKVDTKTFWKEVHADGSCTLQAHRAHL